MRNRLLPLSLALSLVLTAPGLPAYAAAGQALEGPAKGLAPDVMPLWSGAVNDAARALQLNPQIPGALDVAKTLGHAQVALSFNPQDQAALAFAQHLPEDVQRFPGLLLMLEASDQAKLLAPAIKAAGERLEPRASQLLRIAAERELRPDEAEDVLRLSSAWFYLPPETGAGLRALAMELRGERTVSTARKIADGLTGRKEAPTESEATVVGAELNQLFSDAEVLTGGRLSFRPAGNQSAWVEKVLVPYSNRALELSARRLEERGYNPTAVYEALLTRHRQVFGQVAGRALFAGLRRYGVWTDYVAALSLKAGEELIKYLPERATRRLLAKTGEDYDLQLRIPAWHPAAKDFDTVADFLKDDREAPKDRLAETGLPLFSAFGIKVRANLSFIPILALFSWQIASSFFPHAAPGLPSWVYGIQGFVASAALFASIVAHEFGHALTARLFGVKTRAIILHVLGGMAVMDRELRRAGPEFIYAVAGPMVNVVLAGAFLLAASLFHGAALVAPVLFYLGVANLVTGVFNLVPVFPMDGGRVLRSILAGALKDHYRATKIAAKLGGWAGFAIFMYGGVRVMRGDLGGLMMILMGTFIRRYAAQGSIHPGTDLVEKKAALPPPDGDGGKRLWRKLTTAAKLAAAGPLIALCLPFGRAEVFLRSRELLKRFPKAKTLGGGHSNVVLLATQPDGSRVIVKQYGITGTALARLGRLTLPTPNPGGAGRAARFKADRAAFQDFEAAGIPASRVIASDERTLTNVSTFVEGAPLISMMADQEALGASARSLRMAHDRGWAIIDNQPSNFVIGSDRKAYFIDLEHAHPDKEGAYRAWDIGVYLSWLRAGLGSEKVAQAEKAFWWGYGEVSPELARQVAEVVDQMEQFRPFMKVSFADSESASK